MKNTNQSNLYPANDAVLLHVSAPGAGQLLKFLTPLPYRKRQVQQEMTDITVTVVNARSMHIAHHRRDTLNKHTLHANIWWVGRPVSTVIFQTDGWCQIFGNNKRGSGQRINAFSPNATPYIVSTPTSRSR